MAEKDFLAAPTDLAFNKQTIRLDNTLAQDSFAQDDDSTPRSSAACVSPGSSGLQTENNNAVTDSKKCQSAKCAKSAYKVFPFVQHACCAEGRGAKKCNRRILRLRLLQAKKRNKHFGTSDSESQQDTESEHLLLKADECASAEDALSLLRYLTVSASISDIALLLSGEGESAIGPVLSFLPNCTCKNAVDDIERTAKDGIFNEFIESLIARFANSGRRTRHLSFVFLSKLVHRLTECSCCGTAVLSGALERLQNKYFNAPYMILQLTYCLGILDTFLAAQLVCSSTTHGEKTKETSKTLLVDEILRLRFIFSGSIILGSKNLVKQKAVARAAVAFSNAIVPAADRIFDLAAKMAESAVEARSQLFSATIATNKTNYVLARQTLGAAITAAALIRAGLRTEKTDSLLSNFLRMVVELPREALPPSVIGNPGSSALDVLSQVDFSDIIAVCEKPLLRVPDVVLGLLSSFANSEAPLKLSKMPINTDCARRFAQNMCGVFENAQCCDLGAKVLKKLFERVSSVPELASIFALAALQPVLEPTLSTLSHTGKTKLFAVVETLDLPEDILSRVASAIQKDQTLELIVVTSLRVIFANYKTVSEKLRKTVETLCVSKMLLNAKLRSVVANIVYEAHIDIPTAVLTKPVALPDDLPVIALLLKAKLIDFARDEKLIQSVAAAKPSTLGFMNCLLAVAKEAQSVNAKHSKAASMLLQKLLSSAIHGAIFSSSSGNRVVDLVPKFPAVPIKVLVAALSDAIERGIIQNGVSKFDAVQTSFYKKVLIHYAADFNIPDLFVHLHHPSLSQKERNQIYKAAGFLLSDFLGNDQDANLLIQSTLDLTKSTTEWQKLAAETAIPEIINASPEKGFSALSDYLFERFDFFNDSKNDISNAQQEKSAHEIVSCPDTISEDLTVLLPMLKKIFSSVFSISTLRRLNSYSKVLRIVQFLSSRLQNCQNYIRLGQLWENLYLSQASYFGSSCRAAAQFVTTATREVFDYEKDIDTAEEILCDIAEVCDELPITLSAAELIMVLLSETYHLIQTVYNDRESTQEAKQKTFTAAIQMCDVFSQVAKFASSNFFPASTAIESLFFVIKTFPNLSAPATEALQAIVEHTPHLPASTFDFICGQLRSECTPAINMALKVIKFSKRVPAPAYSVMLCILAAHEKHEKLAKEVMQDLQIVLDLKKDEALASSLSVAELMYYSRATGSMIPGALKNNALSKSKLESVIGNIFNRFRKIARAFSDSIRFSAEEDEPEDAAKACIGLANLLGELLKYAKPDINLLKRWLPMLDCNEDDVRYALLDALCRFVQSAPSKEIFVSLKQLPEAKKEIIRQAMVVLIGTCAQGLPKDDPELHEIKDTLLQSLTTSSEKVQRSSAVCLARMPLDASDLLNEILVKLFKESDFMAQRGLSFAVAEIINLNRQLLHKSELTRSMVQKLKTRSANFRQGAFVLTACCALVLGRVFEPSVIVLMPLIVNVCAEFRSSVRDFFPETVDMLIKSTSPSGLRLMVPGLLKNVQTDDWRTKSSILSILAAIARTVPDQLADCLPQIMDGIFEALHDSHEKVCETAISVLRTFSAFSKTPELAFVSQKIVDALIQPKLSFGALQAIRQVRFKHYLDTSSLAIMLPFIKNGIASSHPEERGLALELLGSVVLLIPVDRIGSHATSVLNVLWTALLDSVDAYRTLAARVLGMLVCTLGLDAFPDLFGHLFRMLQGSRAINEKAGAAQAIAEVYAAVGLSSLSAEMSKIVSGLKGDHGVAYLQIFVYLPQVVGNNLLPYLPDVLHSVFNCMLNPEESMQALATKALDCIVDSLGAAASNILMGHIVVHLLHYDADVRLVAIRLLGSLLDKISSSSLTASTQNANNTKTNSEDDNEEDGTAGRHAKFEKVLGKTLYQQAFAALFILRNDLAGNVRQSSSKLWRANVSTPRMIVAKIGLSLVEICVFLTGNSSNLKPLLFSNSGDTILDEYDEEIYEACTGLRHMSSKTLAELVSRYPEVLANSPVIAMLHRNVSNTKIGTLNVLSRYVETCSSGKLREILPDVVQILFSALKDDPPEWFLEHFDRTVKALYNSLGEDAASSVCFPFIEALPKTLDGLIAIMDSEYSELFLDAVFDKAMRNLNQNTSRALSKVFNVAPISERVARFCSGLLEAESDITLIENPLASLFRNVLSESDFVETHSVLESKIFVNPVGVAFVIRQMVALKQNHDLWVEWTRWLLSLTVQQVEGRKQTGYLERVSESVVSALSDMTLNAPTSIQESLVLAAVSCIARGGKNHSTVFWRSPRAPSAFVPLFLRMAVFGTRACCELGMRGVIELVRWSEPEQLRPHVAIILGQFIRLLSESGDQIGAANFSGAAVLLGPAAAQKLLVLRRRELTLECVALVLNRAASFAQPFVPQLTRALVSQAERGAGKPEAANACVKALVALYEVHPQSGILVKDLLQVLNGVIEKSEGPKKSAASISAPLKAGNDGENLWSKAIVVLALTKVLHGCPDKDAITKSIQNALEKHEGLGDTMKMVLSKDTTDQHESTSSRSRVN